MSDPSDQGGLLKAAAEHRAAGRLREAEDLYRQALRDNPNESGAIHGLGLLALHMQKTELAAAYLAQAAGLSPGNAGYHQDHGDAWLQIGEFSLAAACYQRALALEPAMPGAHAALGIALERLKRFDDAILAFRKSIDLGVSRPDIYQHLAHALLQVNCFTESEIAARKAVEGAPTSAESWQTLGEAVGNQQRPDEAMECFRTAISHKPQLPIPHYALGITLGRAGRMEEAVACLKTAVRLRPEFPEALTQLGTMLVGRRELDPAIQTLREAARLRPSHLDTHVELARAYEIAQRPQDAAEMFEKILKLSPNNQNVKFHLAALSGKDAPSIAPAGLVTTLFDRHAQTFDHHLTEQLEYRVPQLLRDALTEAEAGDHLDVLDLGCGTGLCGMLLRPIARTLTGIDLSKGMIEMARQRGIYDALEVAEIVAALRAKPEAYDLLVAGDVFCYVGDLSEVVEAAAFGLRRGGWFAFSVEKSETPNWVLRASRRYAHHPNYIRQLASQFGFEVIQLVTRGLRKEAGKDLLGLVVVLRRSDHG